MLYEAFFRLLNRSRNTRRYFKIWLGHGPLPLHQLFPQPAVNYMESIWYSLRNNVKDAMSFGKHHVTERLIAVSAAFLSTQFDDLEGGTFSWPRDFSGWISCLERLSTMQSPLKLLWPLYYYAARCSTVQSQCALETIGVQRQRYTKQWVSKASLSRQSFRFLILTDFICRREWGGQATGSCCNAVLVQGSTLPGYCPARTNRHNLNIYYSILGRYV